MDLTGVGLHYTVNCCLVLPLYVSATPTVTCPNNDKPFAFTIQLHLHVSQYLFDSESLAS